MFFKFTFMEHKINSESVSVFSGNEPLQKGKTYMLATASTMHELKGKVNGELDDTLLSKALTFILEYHSDKKFELVRYLQEHNMNV